MFGRSILAAALAGICALPARGYAQEPDEDEVFYPGTLEEPPGPAPAKPPEIQTDDRQRRAIRGRPIEAEAEDDDRRALREWEEAAFPRQTPGEAHTADADAEGARVRTVARADDIPPELTGHGRPDDARPQTALRPEEVRPDLPWLKGLATGDLPIRWNDRVIRYLEFYRDDPRGHAIMAAWLRDQGRFRDLIVEALRRNKLPEDLLYVCMIESSYDPWEYSRAGASGLWQFMPAGGRIYGLTQDYWVDERNDPEKATEAAMLYWRDLYDRFGDWHLALAAYNAGYGAVLKAIAKYNSNDFWNLVELESALPWGSAIYVPKALAAAVVGHNLDVFGFADVAREARWEFDRVTVPKSVALSVIARAAGSTASEIAWYNPELRRGRTPPGGSYTLRVPKGSGAEFARVFPQLRADWDGYDAYLVRHGERFEDIARTYGVSVKKLRELNGVDDVSEVHGGLVIVVPKIEEEARQRNQAAAEEELYRSEVVPGDPGDPMIVPVPDKDLVVEGKKRVFYRVVAGDTLESVARALGVKIADLARWNAIATDALIHPRMVVIAWVAPDFDAVARNVVLLDEARLMLVTSGSAEHMDLVEGRRGRKRVKHVVKRGETLESIGRPHHLTKYDMARINRRSMSTPLDAGEELIVYVVVDKPKAKQAGVYKKKKPVPPRPVQRPKKPVASKKPR